MGYLEEICTNQCHLWVCDLVECEPSSWYNGNRRSMDGKVSSQAEGKFVYLRLQNGTCQRWLDGGCSDGDCSYYHGIIRDVMTRVASKSRRTKNRMANGTCPRWLGGECSDNDCAYHHGIIRGVMTTRVASESRSTKIRMANGTCTRWLGGECLDNDCSYYHGNIRGDVMTTPDA